MNFINNQNNQINSLLEALKGTKKTTEPDGVETELIEGAIDRDGSYHQAYEDYISEEMRTIMANRFN